MDYVVFGIGFGATLILLGWALRTFGPGLRFRPPQDGDGVLSGEELLGKLSWTRFVTACGAVVGTGGAVMVVATVIAVLLEPSDRAGTLVVLSCFFLILIAAVGWFWVYVGRYGTHGILPARTEPQSPLRSAPEAPREERPAPRPRRQAPTPEFAGPPVPSQNGMAPPFGAEDEPVPEPSFVPEEHDEVVDEVIADAPVAAPVAEPEEQSDISADEGGGEDSPALEESAAPEAPAPDAMADERGEGGEYVDILPRSAPSADESGRAEALRNLRMRRSARQEPDER